MAQETTTTTTTSNNSNDRPGPMNNNERNTTTTATKTASKNHYSDLPSPVPPPPTVYGELSILGYNGYIPNVERTGRRNRSKFLLCKRPAPNGIKKSRHYIVKQPQATKAIQDKDLHSISYTFSRSQTIIVEYGQDESTDMFQIGRSSEDPIDFVVMDTATSNMDQASSHHSHNHHHHNHHHGGSSRYNHNENNSSGQQLVSSNDLAGLNRPFRHLGKSGDEMVHYGGAPPPRSNNPYDPRNQIHYHRHQAQAVLLNYPQPNISNLPPMMAEHFRNQDSPAYYHHTHNHGHSSGAHQQHHQQQQPPQPSGRSNGINHNVNHTDGDPNDHCSSRHNLISKRSNTTQSTISRFACRILVDRKPPYTARIYAAGFDSSKNIFLGEKATKWEQSETIDGLTTNGVLLMHPKRGHFYDDSDELKQASHSARQNSILDSSDPNETGGVWREVSVDGGVYAIRESRSAAQKGTRIEDETNILQDGTLIDLCGATLLWRSVDGFKTSPTKKTLEEKIDMLNASRPQCPVGLNTLIIPRKPVLPNNHNHHHHHSHHRSSKEHHTSHDNDKNSHQPYVYLRCGHVQGYHDWGATEKSNQRTCPICLSVGTVAKLSMGLEPSFYVDSGPLTHVFNPCGHMASERTVRYWCSIKIPHGTHFFHSICPFCATPVATSNEPAYQRLIFQDDLD